MWKGKVIFMKKLIRKTLAGICFATLIIADLTGMTACGNKTSDGGQTDVDYKYASYVYDDNAPQYYMSDSAAAAETGYYYIAGGFAWWRGWHDPAAPAHHEDRRSTPAYA